jgi:molybdate transport system regulatory protein
MKISARNVLAGKIQSITRGVVNAEVTLMLQGGETVTAIITNGSVDSLELKEGRPAYAVIKASEVMIGKSMDGLRLSARNRLAGKVTKLQAGIVSCEVVMELPSGTAVVASITKDGATELGLKEGDTVSAIVKASSVLIGV